MSSREIVPIEIIERRIYHIRGQRVMLDNNLAQLYGVPTKALNLAVRRNRERFPEDFMFRLTTDEVQRLRFQIETSNVRRGGRRYLPYAFTQEGVAMLSGILRSKQAVRVNIEIMRAFVRMRELLVAHKDLSRKLAELEKKYDKQFVIVFDAIRRLLEPTINRKQEIGFRVKG